MLGAHPHVAGGMARKAMEVDVSMQEVNRRATAALAKRGIVTVSRADSTRAIYDGARKDGAT